MAKGKDAVETKLSEMNDSMLAHFDKIYGKLENLGQENTFINAGLKRMEEKLDRVESKLDAHIRQPAHV
jgi:hypothetical protein